MKRVWAFAAMLAVITFLGAVLPSLAEQDKDPTIKDVMKKANGGSKGLCAIVGADLKGKDIKWEQVQKESKELATCLAFLAKNKPPRGEQASWDKLTKEYIATAKELVEAADKKDAKEALALHKKLVGACMSCHEAHKPAKGK